MTEDSDNIPAVNVPALACAALKDFLAKAIGKIPPGLESAESIYQTLDKVLDALGQSAVDGCDRRITIRVRHIDAHDVRINVISALNPPEAVVEQQESVR